MRLVDAIPPKAPRRERRADPFAGADSVAGAATANGGPSGSLHVFAGAPLSLREMEVLGRLAGGLTYKEIALEIGVATSTVRTHLHNIYIKLDVVDRAQAVLKAIREGLIFNEDGIAKMVEPLVALGIDERAVSEMIDVLRERVDHDPAALRRSLERVRLAKTVRGRANALSAVAALALRAASALNTRP